MRRAAVRESDREAEMTKEDGSRLQQICGQKLAKKKPPPHQQKRLLTAEEGVYLLGVINSCQGITCERALPGGGSCTGRDETPVWLTEVNRSHKRRTLSFSAYRLLNYDLNWFLHFR